MKTHRWEDVKGRKLSREKLKRVAVRVDVELLEMDLKEIREPAGVSQTELARVAEMTQPEVSKLEQRSDYRVSTLRRIVRALGGDLEVVARFGNRQVRLRATS